LFIDCTPGFGGAGGCRYGIAGNHGSNGLGGTTGAGGAAGGTGAGGTGQSNACATTFGCGSKTCRLGEEYCYGLGGGAGAPGSGGYGGHGGSPPPDPHTCMPVPAACAGNPTCDCVPRSGSSCTCNASDGIVRLDCYGA
jgi:hypothetical protein